MVFNMSKDTNMSIRVDTTLKYEAEKVLQTFGLTMGGTINMLLKQIVREQAVPLTLSLNSSYALYADLLEAQTERANGNVGRSGRDVLDAMEEIILMAEADGEI